MVARLDVDIAGTATTAEHALELIAECQPDLVVTEIDFGAGTDRPPELLRRIRAAAAQARILVLTAVADTREVQETLRAGAAAYVLKTALSADLAVAVRQSFRPSLFLPVGEDRAVRPDAAETVDDKKLHSLTRREREILKLLADGRPNAALAKDLWVSQQTIKFHLSNIFRKLGVSNRTEASRWAHDQGLTSEASDRVA